MTIAHLTSTMKRAALAAAAVVIASGHLAAQAEKGTYVLMNARLETITKGVIENGSIVISNGRITEIGTQVKQPEGAEIIDCGGLTVYPGFIDAGTQLGLIEVGSLSETRDDDELGDVTPQMQALTAVNPNSVEIPVTRVSGVTTALTVPTGGLLPGTAALIDLIGYTPRQMLVGGFRAVVMNFPSSAHAWWDDRSDDDVAKAYRKARAKLDDIWQRAQLYDRIDSAATAHPDANRPPEYQPELAALLPVVRRTMPLLIEVNAANDIDSALAWVKANNVRAVFTGVAEGWRVADSIAAAGIPCIVGPVLSIPTRESDRYDKAYANPGLLRKAGVTVAIRTSDASNSRNLPYNAGFAAAYGMGRDEALKAVTIVPARIFGVDSLIGSLEVGKMATLFVANGDAFEPETQVRYVFIDGYKVPMESRQTRLYKEFLHREPGLAK